MQQNQDQWMGSMDILSKWNQRTREFPFSASQNQPGPTPEIIQALVEQYERVWWSCERTLPVFRAAYSNQQHADNDRRLGDWINGLVYELKRIPAKPEERAVWQERLRPAMYDFARTAMNLEQRHLDFIESTGMAEASQEFAHMARRFDPKISADDIYQAGRNIMTANFMQVLMGLPVEVTPSVFAYSMLYPYTDNYLDDPNIAPTTKLAFNHRFRSRLKGEDVHAANAHEATINKLIEMIEQQWDRARYPQVYESLLAIHTAQARSLKLVVPGALPYELDVLGISFEKGGTSVLADGYLVAGELTPDQIAFMFGYGAFTQLMDDLEDIQDDLHEGRMTIFSQTAGRWPLDTLTNRVFHFGRATFGDLSAFSSQAASSMAELIERGMDPALSDIIGRMGKYYSKDYLRAIEQHIPFRMSSLNKQREKLTRQKISLGKIIETML